MSEPTVIVERPARMACAPALALILAVMMAAASAQAATFTVINANDAGPGSLRQAVSDANTNADPTNIIEFDPAVTSITLTSGQIDVQKTLWIVGPPERVTINGNDNSRIFGTTTSGFELRLENLVLTNGRTVAPGSDERGSDPRGSNPVCAATNGQGGAVCVRGILVLVNTSIVNSRTEGDDASGGGFFSQLAVLTDSTISGNETQGDNAPGGGFAASSAIITGSNISFNRTAGTFSCGGGFHVSGILPPQDCSPIEFLLPPDPERGAGGSFQISDSVIEDNETVGERSDGGGFHVRVGSASTLIENTLVRINRTTAESAIAGGFLVDSGNFSLVNSLVLGNASEQSAIGGFEVVAPEVSIENTLIEGNSALVDSGAFFITGALTMEETTIHDNRTQGALDNITARVAGVWGPTVIRNSTISGNNLLEGGLTAGLSLSSNQASIFNSTITGNTGGGGGGLAMIIGGNEQFTLDLSSTILGGNTGSEGNFHYIAACIGDCEPVLVLNVDHSLFGDPPAVITGTSQNNIFSNLPMLDVIADNGCGLPAGPPGMEQCVPLHAILPGSPAIDAGSNPQALSFDQRGSGFPRVLSTQTDIGAFESELTGQPQIPEPFPVPALTGPAKNLMILILFLLTWLTLRRSAIR